MAKIRLGVYGGFVIIIYRKSHKVWSLFGRGGGGKRPPNGVGLTINKYNYLFQIEKFRLGVRSYLDPFVDPMVNPLKRLFQGDNQEKVSKVCFLFFLAPMGLFKLSFQQITVDFVF